MYDCHYDMLTYIYINRDNLKDVKEYCKKIFRNNIEGGIYNLFYMSEKEMHEELGINLDEIDIIQNLKDVLKLIKENHLIPKKINYKIGIEGLDYLDKIDDIDKLYELGVRVVTPVWNNHNKFGTGVRPIEILNKQKGLTELGRNLIKKLIDKGIAIDLSHSDEETFWDIIEICREYKYLHPKVLASHSNCKAICDVPRNLTDEQIKSIADLGGIIGVVGVKKFCSIDKDANFKQAYIKHIIHIRELLGNIDNIAIATDDMTYYKKEPEIYQNLNVFNQENIRKEIIELLKNNKFSDEEVEKITRENFSKYFW